MFTILILFSVVYLLHDTFAKAREYYLDHITDPSWRAAMNISYNEDAVALIQSQALLGSVFPKHVHLWIIIVGILLSCLFIGFGSIGIATLLYAGFALVILPPVEAHGDGMNRQRRPSFFERLTRWLRPSRPAQSSAAPEIQDPAATPPAPRTIDRPAAGVAPPHTGALGAGTAPDDAVPSPDSFRSPEYWLRRVETERSLRPACDPLVLMSFASEDQDWTSTLRAFLDPQLEQLRNPDGRPYQLWNFSNVKRGTVPGDEFPEIIAEKMWSCQVALVLLSKHYFRSDYCRQIELPFLMWRREHQSLLCVPLKLGALPLERVRLPDYKHPTRRVLLENIIDDRQAAANFANSPHRDLNLQQLKERGIESEIDDQFEGLARRITAHLKTHYAAIEEE